MDARTLRELAPALSRVYHLEHDPQTGRTRVEQDEKAVANS